jgi:3-oxoacyl-[acyl-carrier protein] reductase
MTRFEGKTAVVTGGAKGIGAATARRLASEGATVVVADFDEEGAQRTAAEIGGHAVRCDVTKLADVEAAVAAAKERGGSVDILVTCAGIIRDNLLFKMTDDDSGTRSSTLTSKARSTQCVRRRSTWSRRRAARWC